MRVRRSSGSVRGSKASGASKGKGAKGVAGANFAQMVARAGGADSTEAMARNVRSALLEELMGVAQEIAESGDRREGTRKFVHAVIKDRFKNLKGKGATRVEESVTDLIERDENLAQRLHSQLQKLAKS
jgi:hypothetical protein